MSRERFDEETLTRLLGARRAAADPATLARALARVRAGGASRDATEPAWLVWLGRPVALATAASLLVVSIGASVWYGGGAAAPNTTAVTATSGSDLLGSLLGDEGETDNVTGGSVIDSGGVQ